LNDLIEEVISTFISIYNTKPTVSSRAPGRANLIGEHTDYNLGFVLPLAINREIVLVAHERDDEIISLYSIDFGEKIEFNPSSTSYNSQYSWSNYFQGVVYFFRQKGYSLKGMNVAIKGNIPIGSGLSSSAAFEIAAAFLLKKMNNIDIANIEVINLCQKAENEFVGVKCGIMDQFTSCMAQRGKAILLDCKDLSYEYINIPEGITIALCDTGVKRELANSEYNRRRAECDKAVLQLKSYLKHINSLRDVTMQDLEKYGSKLDSLLLKRSRHVISENYRVMEAVNCLNNNDLNKLGQLMYASHKSLKDDYQVSCPELDTMVEIAQDCPYVYGARMMGAGFGGCTISLVNEKDSDLFKEKIIKNYTKITAHLPKVYLLSSNDGAAFKKNTL
jgi:galactokinase